MWNGIFSYFTAERDPLPTSIRVRGEPSIVTDGGRVLGVTALGNTHEEARRKAYENVERIHFEGAQYRRDIGRLNGNERKIIVIVGIGMDLEDAEECHFRRSVFIR
jgi:phosphoribosylamine-glycine ligase